MSDADCSTGIASHRLVRWLSSESLHEPDPLGIPMPLKATLAFSRGGELSYDAATIRSPPQTQEAFNPVDRNGGGPCGDPNGR